MSRLTALFTIGLLSLAATAGAQSSGTVAVGMNLSIRDGIASGTTGHVTPGLIWRIGHGHDGWGWQYGLGWYAADLRQPLGAQSTDFGELHVRPLMAGYGYQKRFGRLLVGPKLLVGYSFNSFDLKPAFGDAYQRVNGASLTRTDVSNTVVIRPEVSTWFDLNRKVGLNISAGYTFARPEVTVWSALGTDSRHIRADMFSVQIGAVYSIF